jgi:general secretion pathway protein D
MSPDLFASWLVALVFFGGDRPAEQPCPGDELPPSSAAQTKADPPASEKMVQVVYPVAELVIPVMQAGQPSGPGWDRAARLTVDEPPGQQTAKIHEARLMRLIRRTVSPDSWSERGGQGKMDFYPLGLSLVVYQTPAVQAEVAHLLAALRRVQDTEVAVEIRVLSLSEGFVGGEGWESAIPRGAASILQRLRRPSILDDRQVHQLLVAAQGDRRTNTMQAPRLTVLNGQQAVVETTCRKAFVTGMDVVRQEGKAVAVPRTETFNTGIAFSVRPVVSADRHMVRMHLRANFTELESTAVPELSVITHLQAGARADGTVEARPVRQVVQQPSFQSLKINKTFQIPDGKTAVLVWGKVDSEVQPERNAWADVLSMVPLLDQFVHQSPRQSHKDTRSILVLITPRIVISEEEVKKPGQEDAIEGW